MMSTVERLEKISEETTRFKEAVLFAKYYCMLLVDRLQYWNRKLWLSFDVEDYISDINKIYEYDKNYWKVETLKGMACEIDDRFSATSKCLYENVTKSAKLIQSKSECYIIEGNWKYRNHQIWESSELYRYVYTKNPKNIEAIFALSVSNEIDEIYENKLLDEILEILEPCFEKREDMGLHDIIMLWKVYNIKFLKNQEPFRADFKPKIIEVGKYIETGLEQNTDDFVSKMYLEDSIKLHLIEGVKSNFLQRRYFMGNNGEEDYEYTYDL